MTIIQLKYVIALANASSMREAASKLFVSQPALSATIRELEEALGEYDFVKRIKSNDRATSMEIIAGMNGFSIGTGIMTESVAISNDLVCIKLKEDDPLTIGYIIRTGHILSEIGQKYIEEIEKYKVL